MVKKRIALTVSLIMAMALLMVAGIAFTVYPIASLRSSGIERALISLDSPISDIQEITVHGSASEPTNQVTFLANDSRGRHLYLARLQRGWFGRYRFLSIDHTNSPLVYAGRESLEGRDGILVFGINPGGKADSVVVLFGDNEFRISLRDRSEFCFWNQNLHYAPILRFFDSAGRDITTELGYVQSSGGGAITQEKVTWMHILVIGLPAAWMALLLAVTVRSWIEKRSS